MRYVIFGAIKALSFSLFVKCLHVLENKSGRGENFSRENNLLLESENPAMKIFKLLSIIEGQCGDIRLNIAIHPSKVRGKLMEKSGEYSPSLYLIIMSADNFVGLRCHGGFYTSVICHCH